MRRKFKTVRRVFVTYGVSEVLRLILRKFFTRDHGLEDFDSQIVWGSANQFLNRIALEKSNGLEIDNANSILRTGFFDEIYDLGPELSSVVNSLVISTNPELIIETGVAAGKSTNIILKQLHRSAGGRLVSIDITANVGELVETQYKYLWDLEVLPSVNRKYNYKRILLGYPKASIFLHDSDHSARWQEFEIFEAIRLLPNLSFLLIDDIQAPVANKLILRFGLDNCYFLNEMDKKKSLVVSLV